MTTAKEAMRLIQQLDDGAHIEYSSYTNQWYVESKIGISNGSLISSGSEHRDEPEDAVLAFLDKLKNISENEFIVTAYPQRQEWRYQNGKFSLSEIGNKLRIQSLLRDREYQLKRILEEQDALIAIENKLVNLDPDWWSRYVFVPYNLRNIRASGL